MKLGVVILNFNLWEMTANLAKKMASFSVVNKVVVVDNASTDHSFINLELLESSKITVINSNRNGGYSYGNNLGAKILYEYGCDYLIVANPDIDVEEKSIIKILTVFDNNKDFGVLTGIEYDMEGNMSKTPIYGRNRYIDDLKDCFYLGRKIQTRKIAVDYSNEVQPVKMVKGSFFIAHMESFAKVNGFDENVFLFCEERIISRKMENIGKMLGVVTTAKYKHKHSASISREHTNVSKQIKMLYKSRYYYNCKYNSINKFQRCILYLAMNISIFEYMIIDYAKKML